MVSLDFQAWRTKNPSIEQFLFYPDGLECRWGRVNGIWHEKKELEDRIHRYAFVMDLKNGDLYLDCRKRKIWTKCVVLTFVRPVFGLIKTVYHLALPFSIPLEIFYAVREGRENKRPSQEIFYKSLRAVKYNLSDIVRTPCYTLALTIIHSVGIVVVLFKPNKLYDIRRIAGCLEQALTRQENHWTLAPCFQHWVNIQELGELNKKAYFDTDYEENYRLVGLNNLTRQMVNIRREHRLIFNDCGLLLDKNIPYKSSAYLTADRTK